MIASFSFEAGASERASFWANRGAPVVRSTARAADLERATCGTLSAFASRAPSGLSARVAPTAGADAARQVETAIAATARRIGREGSAPVLVVKDGSVRG